MLENLEHRVVQIAVFGMVGRGKSSLLNALLGQVVQPVHYTALLALSQVSWSISEETVGKANAVCESLCPVLGNLGLND